MSGFGASVNPAERDVIITSQGPGCAGRDAVTRLRRTVDFSERGSGAPLEQARASDSNSPYRGSNASSPAIHSGVWPGFPRDAEIGRKSRLFAHSLPSLGSRFADPEEEIAESLRPCPQIFPFWGDYRRRLVGSRLPPDHGTLFLPDSPAQPPGWGKLLPGRSTRRSMATHHAARSNRLLFIIGSQVRALVRSPSSSRT